MLTTSVSTKAVTSQSSTATITTTEEADKQIPCSGRGDGCPDNNGSDLTTTTTQGTAVTVHATHSSIHVTTATTAANTVTSPQHDVNSSTTIPPPSTAATTTVKIDGKNGILQYCHQTHLEKQFQ